MAVDRGQLHVAKAKVQTTTKCNVMQRLEHKVPKSVVQKQDKGKQQ